MSSPLVNIAVEPVDLATANQADFDRLLTAHCGAADHAVAVIVHNAGTLGQVEHLRIQYTLWDESSREQRCRDVCSRD